MIFCAPGSQATASRTRSRTPGQCGGGHARKSMPARSSLRSRGATNKPARARMTRSDATSEGAAPPDRRAKAASPARVVAFQTGLSGESRAAAFLIAKGYRILARRFRTPYGEIDIVARRRNLLAFIEVKARDSLDDAAYAVTPRTQRRIIDAAQAWLMTHPEHAEFEMRFDVMLVAPKRLPRHLLAAFDAST